MKKAHKLGVYLRQARLKQGLSLRALAELTQGGISNPYIHQLETGRSLKPCPTHLRALAGALKLNYLDVMIVAGYLTKKDLLS